MRQNHLLHAWEEAVYGIYLREEKIEPSVVEQMCGWTHLGFSVDQSVFLRAGDQGGIERLRQYMTRCRFSLLRLVKARKDGMGLYKAEKPGCRAIPEPSGDGIKAGAKRNFQVLIPLDFRAEFTQHIPAKGAHLVRYYGWYSNKSRGLGLKAGFVLRRASSARSAAGDAPLAAPPPPPKLAFAPCDPLDFRLVLAMLPP